MANPVQQGLKLVGDRRPWRIAWAEMANPVQQGLKHGEPLTYVQVAGLFNAEQTVHSLGFSADRML